MQNDALERFKREREADKPIELAKTSVLRARHSFSEVKARKGPVLEVKIRD
jgi:hypothetical protein